MKALEQKGILSSRGGRMQAEAEAGACAMARIGLPTEGSEVGKEIVNSLKILCFVSVCVLFVMVLNLFVNLMK
jgi:hypothetical protein